MISAALMPVFAAAFVASGCYATGTLALRWTRAKVDSIERIPLAFLLGAAFLHLAIFALMSAHLTFRAAWWILIGGLIIAAIRQRAPRSERRAADWTLRIVFGAITIPFTILYFVNAWAPETSPDGASYHLAIVARYLREHGFVRITTSMYADLSQGVELLYAPAFAIGRHSAAALVHFAFLLALALAIYAYGKRIGEPWAGAAAAAIVYASPVAARDGTTAYIDVAGAAIAFASFYWLEIWDTQREARILAAAGFMAGYAFAAKYTLFVVVPVALIYVFRRERRFRPLLIVSSAAAVMIAPWLIKNWIFVRDPIAPFATTIFPTPYLHTLTVQEWAAWLRRYDVKNFWTLPREVTLIGGLTQGTIGPIFLLAPLGVLALRNRHTRWLLAMGAALLATYFGNLGTRFLLPCLPFFALALCLAFARSRIMLTALVLAQAVGSWYSVLPLYANQYTWRIYEFPYKAALRLTPSEQYLGERIGEYNFLRSMEAQTKPGDRILAFAGVAASYTSREIFGSYEGAENNTLTDIFDIARYDPARPSRLLTFHFPEQQTRRIRLMLANRATAPQQWNVHELRFYSRGSEIERSRDWRLTSRPNPWEIQMAFDNSPVTRWRSYQTGEPGMYIQVDFGKSQLVDEIRMWTSHDFEWPMRFEVQSFEAGAWRKAGDSFEETEIPGHPFLGRAATAEILARGVGYIVVPNSDPSAEDLADGYETWGLKPVLHQDGLTLYKILPP